MENLLPLLPLLLIVSTVLTISILFSMNSKTPPHPVLFVITAAIFLGSFFLISRRQASLFVQIIGSIMCFVSILPLIVVWYFRPVVIAESEAPQADTASENYIAPEPKERSHERAKVVVPKELLQNHDVGGIQQHKKEVCETAAS